MRKYYTVLRKKKQDRVQTELEYKGLSSLVTQKVSMAAHGNTRYRELPSKQLPVTAKKATAAKLASSS